MEFLSVGQIKLKVTLTPEECREYGIRELDGGEENSRVRASLRRILDEAGRRVGFFADGERLLVQVYPLMSDGAELFITKLSAVPESERRVVSESGILTYMNKTAYFRLPDAAALLAVVRALPELIADVYRAHSGEYYLSLSESLLGGISDCDILLEFGERIPRLPLGLSGEWGSIVLRDSPLSALA